MKYIVRLQATRNVEVEIDDEDEDGQDNAISEAILQVNEEFDTDWICLGLRKQ